MLKLFVVAVLLCAVACVNADPKPTPDYYVISAASETLGGLSLAFQTSSSRSAVTFTFGGVTDCGCSITGVTFYTGTVDYWGTDAEDAESFLTFDLTDDWTSPISGDYEFTDTTTLDNWSEIEDNLNSFESFAVLTSDDGTEFVGPIYLRQWSGLPWVAQFSGDQTGSIPEPDESSQSPSPVVPLSYDTFSGKLSFNLGYLTVSASVKKGSSKDFDNTNIVPQFLNIYGSANSDAYNGEGTLLVSLPFAENSLKVSAKLLLSPDQNQILQIGSRVYVTVSDETLVLRGGYTYYDQAGEDKKSF